MCLAIPGKVISLDTKQGTAVVDYGPERRTASTMLEPDVAEGEYVLVQAKLIVQRVPEDQALAALAEIGRHG